MNLYLLPGLGADERLFAYLDLREYTAIPIRWDSPLMNESIEDYAARIASRVDAANAVLIGMSFGGIIAIEIAKIIPVQKVILISSAASYDEIPLVYRLAGRLRLHRVLKAPVLKSLHGMMNWMMGINDPLRKTLFADMLRDADERFLQWAVNEIVSWRNKTVPPNVFRIHGTNDRMLPIRQADYKIKKGGHLCVADHPGEVTAAIKEILRSPIPIENASSPIRN